MMLIRKVDASDMTAQYIELNIKDQYVGRGNSGIIQGSLREYFSGDMFRLKNHLYGSCVYLGKKVTLAGCIRAQIRDIILDGVQVKSGVVSQNTRLVFRSESAKYFIFIQISKEMMEFDENGDVYYEKGTQGFLPELFDRWKRLGTNHVVSVVLFARLIYRERPVAAAADDQDDVFFWHPAKAYCKDAYRVIIDWETRPDWRLVLTNIQEEILKFKAELHAVRNARIAFAFEGNLLESINLAVNIFDKHYVDRDLLRTGLSVVIVTAGVGYFMADKQLLFLTEERMVEDGIGLDIGATYYTIPFQ